MIYNMTYSRRPRPFGNNNAIGTPSPSEQTEHPNVQTHGLIISLVTKIIVSHGYGNAQC